MPVLTLRAEKNNLRVNSRIMYNLNPTPTNATTAGHVDAPHKRSRPMTCSHSSIRQERGLCARHTRLRSVSG